LSRGLKGVTPSPGTGGSAVESPPPQWEVFKMEQNSMANSPNKGRT